MNTISERIPVRLTPFSLFGLLLAIVGCGTIAVDIRTEIISQQEIRQRIEYTIAGPIATLLITDGEVDLSQGVQSEELQAIEQAGWQFEIDVVEIDGEDAVRMVMSQDFKGEDAVRQFSQASEAIAEQDTSTSLVPLLEITESEDEIIYSVRMDVSVDEEPVIPAETGGEDAGVVPTLEPLVINGTPFPGLPDFSDAGGTVDIEGFGGEAFVDGFDEFADALATSFEDFITVRWTVEMPGDVRESNATSDDKSVLTWDLKFSDLSEEGTNELFASSVVSKNASGSCNVF